MYTFLCMTGRGGDKDLCQEQRVHWTIPLIMTCDHTFIDVPRSISSDHALAYSNMEYIDQQPSFPSIHTQTYVTCCSRGFLKGFHFFRRLTATHPAIYLIALLSISVSGLTKLVIVHSWLCFFTPALFFRSSLRSLSKRSCSVSCG